MRKEIFNLKNFKLVYLFFPRARVIESVTCHHQAASENAKATLLGFELNGAVRPIRQFIYVLATTVLDREGPRGKNQNLFINDILGSHEARTHAIYILFYRYMPDSIDLGAIYLSMLLLHGIEARLI